MGKSLCLSLCFLVLFHGCICIAQQQQERQQNKCRISRLSAQEPSNRIQSEAGCKLRSMIITISSCSALAWLLFAILLSPEACFCLPTSTLLNSCTSSKRVAGNHDLWPVLKRSNHSKNLNKEATNSVGRPTSEDPRGPRG
ncbi:hypothetical protein CK203_008817 [Vitis vinifera]|uniref:Uncharacterized protein n=1 Tax=Vitis vinifera TaxID=29760 RepID=A0A438KD07_VITVI|nr:hypothetical protein CK203_008817 [Vitis vinifera]